MPVPVIVSTTVTDQHAGPDTTLVVNMPAARPDGELYLAICMKDDDIDWSVEPTNWTELLNVINDQERLRAWFWIL